MEYSEAVSALRMLVRSDEEPTLTDAELDELLSMSRRSDVGGNPPANTSTVPAHQTSTAYTAGDVVTDAYGRYWVALTSGTTASSAPSATSAAWPDFRGRPRTDHTVRDGGVLWADNGTKWRTTYDLHAAAAMGWRVKAAKVSPKYDFSADGQSYSRRQWFTSCMEMVSTFARKGPATVVVVDR